MLWWSAIHLAWADHVLKVRFRVGIRVSVSVRGVVSVRASVTAGHKPCQADAGRRQVLVVQRSFAIHLFGLGLVLVLVLR